MDYKDILITSTDCGVVAYSKFLIEHRKFDDVVVAFVEGKDAEYYFSKVEKYSGYSSDKIIFYPCGGRVQLELAKNLVDKNIKVPSNVKLLYFADSDYDLQRKLDNVYYTDYYSIENFYCQKKCLELILNKLFNINSFSSDFKICLDLYETLLEKYRSEVVKLNAYCYCIRKKEIAQHLDRVDFKVKFRKMVNSFNLDEFSMKEINFDYLKKTFPYCVEVDEEEYKTAIQIIDEKKLRGKWELEFFCWFLNELKECIHTGKFNLEKRKQLRLDFESQPLIHLSSYAIDTSNLISYISSIQND